MSNKDLITRAREQMEARKYFLLESRCTGKAKAYETKERSWSDIQHNDEEIPAIEDLGLKELLGEFIKLVEADSGLYQMHLNECTPDHEAKDAEIAKLKAEISDLQDKLYHESKRAPEIEYKMCHEIENLKAENEHLKKIAEQGIDTNRRASDFESKASYCETVVGTLKSENKKLREMLIVANECMVDVRSEMNRSESQIDHSWCIDEISDAFRKINSIERGEGEGK